MRVKGTVVKLPKGVLERVLGQLLVADFEFAAREIEAGRKRFCCNALRSPDAVEAFENIFADDAIEYGVEHGSRLGYSRLAWMDNVERGDDPVPARDARVLALCFAAAMAAAGDLP